VQLNVTTDYAIRAMVYLAEEKRMVTGVEIANKMQIPPAYLVTIMKSLREAHFVTVKRGSVGGYMLAKPLSEISLWDIITVMEGNIQFNVDNGNDMFSHQTNTGMGQVRQVYRALQSNLEEQLRAVTLEQLTHGADTKSRKQSVQAAQSVQGSQAVQSVQPG
jgi:Rrf2 family nitric oxide-sensitive transcriptional repressor